VIGVVVVIRQFIPDPEADEKSDGDADGKANGVDKGIPLAPEEIAPRDEDIVLEHELCLTEIHGKNANVAWRSPAVGSTL